MFGYVKEYAPELKVKEHNLYKAVYCGLCKSMGKCCGQCSRLTLSYDITFLAVLRLALSGNSYELKMQRCIAHPFKKRVMMLSNADLEYCAKVSALLSYGKIEDDIADTRGFKRLSCKILKPFFSHGAKRASLTELYDKMKELLSELSECERNKTESIDIPSDIFGNITAEMFSYGLDGGKEKIARSIGFYTGKWIYAADALDDMKNDAKSGSYNPYVLMYGESFPTSDAALVKSAFTQLLAEAGKCADLIDFADDSLKAIVYNIIYEGMKRRSDEIADKAFCNDKKGDKN